jgi:hypothetical protein
MFNPEGWSVDALCKQMRGVFGTRLEPVGLFKKPYPFYDGVKPQE